MSRLAGLYRKGSHVPESPELPAWVHEHHDAVAVLIGATHGPWATHAARCTCNVCR